MSHDVFISYSSKDKAIADAVCATLANNQIRCWIAPRDILQGIEYGQALVNAIKISRAVVLVLSSNSNVSPQVMREVERAVSNGIPIIPLRIENIMPSESMEYYLSSVHWLDAITPPIEQHLDKLTDTVARILGGKVSLGEKDGELPRVGSQRLSVGSTQDVFPQPVASLQLEKNLPGMPGVPQTLQKNVRSGQKLKPLLILIIILTGFAAVIAFGVWGMPSLKAALVPASSLPQTATETVTHAPTPTLTPTITITQTPRPTVTASPVPAWVNDFSWPILAAIADRRPDFQDDFSYATSNWQLRTGEVEISNGTLVFTADQDLQFIQIPVPGIGYYNFVLVVDMNLYGISGEDAGTIKWSEYYVFEIKHDGRWFISSWENNMGHHLDNGQKRFLDTEKVTIMLISDGQEYAVYIDNIPVTYGNYSEEKVGTRINLRAWPGSSTLTAIVKFDNINIWDLDKIPNLP